jgi:uncharacterized phage-associated protein
MTNKTMTGQKALSLSQYIVNYFDENSISITHLKLQKLLYFVHGRSLVYLKESIVDYNFEARIN